MLQPEPYKRITIPELKRTPWFQANLSKELSVRPSTSSVASLLHFFAGPLHQVCSTSWPLLALSNLAQHERNVTCIALSLSLVHNAGHWLLQLDLYEHVM